MAIETVRFMCLACGTRVSDRMEGTAIRNCPQCESEWLIYDPT